MQMNTDDLAECFGQFKKSGNKARRDSVNESDGIFALIAFRNESEVRVAIPNFLCQENIERIWVVGGFRAPVSTLFLRIDDVSFKNLFMRINQTAVLYSAQFFLVDFINLGTHMTIIQMDPIDLVLFY